MEIDLELLTIQNPWWHGGSLKFDPLVESYEAQPFELGKEVLGEFYLSKDIIYNLRGAWSLGKSTIVKILIQKLIEKKKVNPKNIFYYSCRNIYAYEQLNELIKTFLAWRNPTKTNRVFIFLDDITLISNWPKGIDYLVKAGKLKHATVFLVGSTLHNLIGKEATGNFLKTDNKIINSFDFLNFLELLTPEFYKKIKGVSGSSFKKYIQQLDYYLDIYSLTGGFFSSIAGFKNKGAVDNKIYDDFLFWLLNDMAKLGRSIPLLQQILEETLNNLGKPIGNKTIARKTKAKTHLTVGEYLNLLESMFAIKQVYQSSATGELYKSKAKKVYFRDPFIYWVFYSYIHGSLNYWQFSRERLHREDVYLHLIENIIFSHLIKDETLENWGSRVTYWRDNAKKQEISFLVNTGKKIIPILVRYKQGVNEADKKIFKQAGFKQGIIISKNEFWSAGGIEVIPLTYFLLFYKDYLK